MPFDPKSKLHRFFSCVPVSMDASLPKVDTDEDPRECVANVLLPHEVFGALYARDPDQVRSKTYARDSVYIFSCPGKPPFKTLSFRSFNKPCQFTYLMCGNNDGLSILRFWTHIKSLSEYKHHQVLHSLSDDKLKKLVPCCVHGDGAEMFRGDEFFIMNWSSVFGAAGHDCLVSRYPISIVAERQMKTDEVFRFNSKSFW